eukprot:GEMP01053436.1.p1 GENE.GEMP01053436.1~~GEMP01053436.1.p1  ORF type:complete len:208 (+),score=56.66 GEMP01053436.1:194-817(+)
MGDQKDLSIVGFASRPGSTVMGPVGPMPLKCNDQSSSTTASTCSISPTNTSFDRHSDHAGSEASSERVSPSTGRRWRVPPHDECEHNDVLPRRPPGAPDGDCAAAIMRADLAASGNPAAECCVCLDVPANPECVLPCGHVCVCASCVETLASTRNWSKCPYCRVAFKRGDSGYVRASDSFAAFIIRDTLHVFRVGAEMEEVGLRATI